MSEMRTSSQAKIHQDRKTASPKLLRIPNKSSPESLRGSAVRSRSNPSIPDRSKIRKHVNLSGKIPGKKISVTFPTIKKYTPEELQVVLTGPVTCEAVVAQLENGHVGVRFAPPLNGTYKAEILNLKSGKSILSKPLEITIQGLKVDKVTKQLIKNPLRRNSEDKSEPSEKYSSREEVSEKSSSRGSRRLDKGEIRVMLPSNVQLEDIEGVVARFSGVNLIGHLIQLPKGPLAMQFIPPGPGDYSFILTKIISQENLFPNPFQITFSEQFKTTLGQEVVFPLHTTIGWKSDEVTLEDLTVRVKGPKNDVDAQLVKTQDNGISVVFTPWEKGLHRVIVRHKDHVYIQLGIPIVDGHIMQHVLENISHIIGQEGLTLYLPAILTQKGRHLYYSATDLHVTFSSAGEGGKKEKVQMGSAEVMKDGSVKAMFRPKAPGSFRGQVMLWQMPVLAHLVEFVWDLVEVEEVLSPKSSRNGRNGSYLESIIDYGKKAKKPFNTGRFSGPKEALCTEFSEFYAETYKKVQYIFKIKDLNWLKVLGQPDPKLHDVFKKVLLYHTAFVEYLGQNFALIEDENTSENLSEKCLPPLGVTIEQLIALMVETFETDTKLRVDFHNRYYEIFREQQPILAKILLLLKHHLEDVPQTLLVTGLDLYGNEDVTGHLMEILNDPPSYVTPELLCRPQPLPDTLEASINCFEFFLKQYLEELKREDGDRRRTELVSVAYKTALILQEVVVRRVEEEWREKVVVVVEEFNTQLVEVVEGRLKRERLELEVLAQKIRKLRRTLDALVNTLST